VGKWMVRFEGDTCEQSWVVSVFCGVRRGAIVKP